MKGFAIWATSSAAAMGGVGLFLVALLEASFVGVPASDVLAVMTAKSLARTGYYALMLAAGSVAGSLILFGLGRKGGQLFLAKRFSQRRIARGSALVQRYGFLALLVASLMPPPTPFKLLVVVAGGCGMSAWSFVASVALGRGARYFGEGLLALRYGSTAIDVIRGNGAIVALAVATTALAGGAVYFLWRRLHTRSSLESAFEQR